MEDKGVFLLFESKEQRITSNSTVNIWGRVSKDKSSISVGCSVPMFEPV